MPTTLPRPTFDGGCDVRRTSPGYAIVQKPPIGCSEKVCRRAESTDNLPRCLLRACASLNLFVGVPKVSWGTKPPPSLQTTHHSHQMRSFFAWRSQVRLPTSALASSSASGSRFVTLSLDYYFPFLPRNLLGTLLRRRASPRTRAGPCTVRTAPVLRIRASLCRCLPCARATARR